MPRVLLLLPTTTYRTPDFLEAAEKLHADVVVASEEASTLESLTPAGLLALDFRDPAGCARRAAEYAQTRPIDAVVGGDEDTAVVGAAIAAPLGLRHNPIDSVQAARSKGRMRDLLARAGVPTPAHRVFSRGDDPRRVALEVDYPCGLK